MYQRVLTLDGTAQCLLPSAGKDIPIISLILQPRGTNNSPIYVGNNNAVSSSNYMFRLEAGDTADIPPAPFILEFAFQRTNLSSFWVIGANAELLHIGAASY